MKNKYSGKLIHRSFLFSPAHNEKFLLKSFQTDADTIIYDLEDAVPNDKKEDARNILKTFLSQTMPDDRPVYVRINPIESGLTLLDLDAVICENINGFVYPMSNTAEDMIAFAAQLTLKETVLNLPKNYFDIIEDTFKTLINSSRGIEVNMSGFRYRIDCPLPDLSFVKLYHDLGGEIITVGTDAHSKHFVGKHLDLGYQLIEKAGFKYVTTFRERKPSFVALDKI